MEVDMIAQHMVTQIERARLPKLAERGRLIEEAMAARQDNPSRLALWGWLGRVLHLSGQRTARTPQTAATDPH